jgi:hypothetical protein
MPTAVTVELHAALIAESTVSRSRVLRLQLPADDFNAGASNRRFERWLRLRDAARIASMTPALVRSVAGLRCLSISRCATEVAA